MFTWKIYYSQLGEEKLYWKEVKVNANSIYEAIVTGSNCGNNSDNIVKIEKEVLTK